MQRWLTYLFLFSVPFTSAFALHRWLHLYTAVVLASIVVWVFRGVPNKLRIEGPDWLILGAVGLGFLGFAFAPAYGERSLNHSLAILTCVGLLYFFVRDVVLPCLTFNTIVKTLTIGLFIHALFVIFEFTMANYVGISLRTWIPYVELAQSTHLSALDPSEESTMLGMWIRPQGVAIEAGHMATFFELCLPLSYLYLRDKSMALIAMFYGVYLIAFAVLSSAGASSSLLMAALAVFLISNMPLGRKLTVVLALSLAFIALYSWPPSAVFLDELIVNKALNFVGLSSTEVFSAVDRSARMAIAKEVVSMYPAGLGWGTCAHLFVSQQTLNGLNLPYGFISMYAEFLVSGGYLALTLYLSFAAVKFYQLFKLGSAESQLLLLSSISILIHFGTLSNYWFPVLWLPFALTSILRREHGATSTDTT